MVRATSLLRNLHNSPLFTASKVPLSVNLGLSYAGKDSPPFVPSTYQPTQAGFQPPTKIGQWVRQSLDLRAGRGELEATEEDVDDGEGARELGILRRQEALRDARVKWGAGEDFFALSSGTGHVGFCGWICKALIAAHSFGSVRWCRRLVTSIRPFIILSKLDVSLPSSCHSKPISTSITSTSNCIRSDSA
jgi:hypothetical protein